MSDDMATQRILDMIWDRESEVGRYSQETFEEKQRGIYVTDKINLYLKVNNRLGDHFIDSDYQIFKVDIRNCKSDNDIVAEIIQLNLSDIKRMMHVKKTYFLFNDMWCLIKLAGNASLN